MVAVPVAEPYTLPAEETVAMPVLLLLHVPPLTASVNNMLLNKHIVEAPVIAEGGVCVNVDVALVSLHPSVTVTVYVAVTLANTVSF